MKLTKAHRDEFVDGVIESIPVKHKFTTSDVQQAITDLAFSALPPDVKPLHKKYPGLVATCSFTHRLLPPDDPLEGVAGLRHVYPYIPRIVDYTQLDLKGITDKFRRHCQEEKDRDELAKRLRISAMACGTLKQLMDQFPELVEFMPTPPEKKEWLPVPVDNLVTDLMKAGVKVKRSTKKATK